MLNRKFLSIKNCRFYQIGTNASPEKRHSRQTQTEPERDVFCKRFNWFNGKSNRLGRLESATLLNEMPDNRVIFPSNRIQSLSVLEIFRRGRALNTNDQENFSIVQVTNLNHQEIISNDAAPSQNVRAFFSIILPQNYIAQPLSKNVSVILGNDQEKNLADGKNLLNGQVKK